MKRGESSTARTLSVAIAADAGTSVFPPDVAPQEVDSKLDAAREQLILLRRQQEELERQKADLEELRRKQEEYTRGKAEMLDNLTRALLAIEREQLQSQRTAELCGATTGTFKECLDQLQAIDDSRWTSANLRAELTRSLGLIETSRMEFNRARTKLDCLNPATELPAAPVADPSAAARQEMLRYLKLGAVASAPLILAGTIWVTLLLAFKR